MEFLSIEREIDVPFPVGLIGIALRRPGALVPEHDGACPILSVGNGAFEAAIVEGMILHMHGEALLARHEARAARDGPALQDAAEFEAKVVVQASRCVLLDDEGMTGSSALLCGRLGGDREIAFALVGLQ